MFLVGQLTSIWNEMDTEWKRNYEKEGHIQFLGGGYKPSDIS